MKLFITAIVILLLGFQNTNAAVPAEANSVCADVNAINVKKFAAQAVAAMDKVTSYQSVLSIMDFAKGSLKGKNFVSIEWVFEYEKPNKFAVDQTSWEENVADRWISIGRKQYIQIGSWFEDKTSDRSQVNKFLTFNKYRPVLQKCKMVVAGVEKIGAVDCIVLKGRLDNSTKNIFPRPKGKNESEVLVGIDKDTMLVAKIVMRCRGTDEKGKKINFEYRQSFGNYNKQFNIVKPAEVED